MYKYTEYDAYCFKKVFFKAMYIQLKGVKNGQDVSIHPLGTAGRRSLHETMLKIIWQSTAHIINFCLLTFGRRINGNN